MSSEARGSKRPSPEHEHEHGGSAGGGAGGGKDESSHFKRKRTAANTAATATAPASAAQSRPIGQAFAHFSTELDRFQDRRERLIKLSRDVTALSKKLIFHLHRWEHPDVDLPSADDQTSSASVEQQALHGGIKRNAKLLEDAHHKLDSIVNSLKEAARIESLSEAEPRRKQAHTNNDEAMHITPSAEATATTAGPSQEEKPVQSPDGDDQPVFLSPRYDRAFGPGLEEFIEAVSFMHFLEHGSIITLEQVQAYFLDDSSNTAEPVQKEEAPSTTDLAPVLLRITAERYILGLSDLTGELMRYATNALSSAAAQKANVVPRTLNILRTLADQFEPFSSFIWNFDRKQRVTIQSLRKIEQLSYSLTVRSVEFGSDPGTLAEIVRRALAAGNPGGDGGGPDDHDE
ncbi:unnamed protein product [Tilletia controversa]|uniref:Translin n=1 Tax=Tilletia controversa TaxID=13291 RepID=A0A8X7MXN0_9BASI|nr:hypothetical protein CF328_g4388 [Tilletia controversa]KAE8253463.1 hypothetical protein A4X06_0g1441 [Tilletia controversa]CAD6977206.1 unnamed protein product [Tilletia controversa]